MTKPTTTPRVELRTHLQWIPLDKIRAAEPGKGQRELVQNRVRKLTSKGFDPEIMGYPVVSERDSHYFIIDGQARIAAIKEWLGEWKGQTVQCRVFKDLTSEQESNLFLELNDTTNVNAWWKFQNAVSANRVDECEVNRVVLANQLVVSREKLDNGVACVSTLMKIYYRSDSTIVARSLRLARDSFGKSAMDAVVLDGLGMLCQRYNGQLPEDVAIEKLATVKGGVNGLLGKARIIRERTGVTMNQAVAAAAVEIINTGNRKKIPGWFTT